MSAPRRRTCDAHVYDPQECHGPIAEYVVTATEATANAMEVYGPDQPIPQRTFHYCPAAVEADRESGWDVDLREKVGPLSAPTKCRKRKCEDGAVFVADKGRFYTCPDCDGEGFVHVGGFAERKPGFFDAMRWTDMLYPALCVIVMVLGWWVLT